MSRPSWQAADGMARLCRVWRTSWISCSRGQFCRDALGHHYWPRFGGAFFSCAGLLLGFLLGLPIFISSCGLGGMRSIRSAIRSVGLSKSGFWTLAMRDQISFLSAELKIERANQHTRDVERW